MEDYGTCVDLSERTVSPRIFVDAAVYRSEQEKIFGRCWLFLAHEGQIPAPFDYVTAFMGEEPIIVWRGGDGRVRAFLNSCRHRGMRVCRTERGRTRTFICPYHGWTYDSQGALVARPQKERYDASFDPARWGLLEVPRVESFAGLVFGCLDAETGSLADYLGDMRWYLETKLNRTGRGTTPFRGIQKWRFKANWKFGAEQFSGDNYHATIAHSSVVALGYVGDVESFSKAEPWVTDFEATLPNGHGWLNLTNGFPPETPESMGEYESAVMATARQYLDETQAGLTVTGAVANVFPNMSLLSFSGCLSLRVWQPKGIDETELWLWVLADADAPAWRKNWSRELEIRSFSTSGLFDQDDSELWQGCQEGVSGFYRRRFPLNFQLGGFTARPDPKKPGTVDSHSSEIGVFGFYQRWRELMSAAAERVG